MKIKYRATSAKWFDFDENGTIRLQWLFWVLLSTIVRVSVYITATQIHITKYIENDTKSFENSIYVLDETANVCHCRLSFLDSLILAFLQSRPTDAIFFTKYTISLHSCLCAACRFYTFNQIQWLVRLFTCKASNQIWNALFNSKCWRFVVSHCIAFFYSFNFKRNPL